MGSRIEGYFTSLISDKFRPSPLASKQRKRERKRETASSETRCVVHHAGPVLSSPRSTDLNNEENTKSKGRKTRRIRRNSRSSKEIRSRRLFSGSPNLKNLILLCRVTLSSLPRGERLRESSKTRGTRKEWSLCEHEGEWKGRAKGWACN